ncbi:MAG: HEAT repeat domain-containing protein [Caldilineaceae bacterium]
MQAQARAWWKQGTQLAQQGQQKVELFDQLVNQLADPDMHVLIPSIWGLQQAGPLAIPALIKGLTHPHTKVRRNCVDIIDHGGYGADGRCIEALLPLLYDRIPHIRRAAWHTLFCERCQDESKCEVMPAEKLDQVALLIEIGIHDPNPKLRGQLIDDLRKLRSDPRAEQALTNAKQLSA